MALAQFWPLNKVTDGDRWNAENLVGRLRIVTHAAFLYTGFRPHGAPASTRWSLSSRYSLPQPAHRDGGEDSVVVMHLSGRGRRYVTTLKTFSVASNSRRRYRERRTRFHDTALAAALSGDLDETFRDLRTPGSAARRLWQQLAYELCPGLFFHVCRTNGIPVAGLASLPGDIVADILARLHSPRDLACAECASKKMRELVTERDADLWKHKFEGTRCCSLCRHVFSNRSWKQMYVNATRCQSLSPHNWPAFFAPQCFDGYLEGQLPITPTLPHSVWMMIKKKALLALTTVPAATPPVATVLTAHSSLLNVTHKGNQDSDTGHCFAVSFKWIQETERSRRHSLTIITIPVEASLIDVAEVRKAEGARSQVAADGNARALVGIAEAPAWPAGVVRRPASIRRRAVGLASQDDVVPASTSGEIPA
ncbi:hypothetical protein EJB05_16863, partial [Eragrostis curvula]